jgi:hypothetical protein
MASNISIPFATNVKRESQAFSALAEPLYVVRDNSEFVKIFDPAKVTTVFRPTRTLVVSQSPRAGELVPVGTPIDLVVTVKESLPLDGLINLDAKVVERFPKKSVGDVLSTVEASEAKRVIERADAGDYDKLSANDKGLVNEYLRANFHFDPAADPAAAKNVYGNVKFLYDF